MILQETKGIEVNSDIEGAKGGISVESLPFMFNILSKSYYSRKIDSIVREVTSNCFDSHIEAGIDDPVIIEKRYDIENDTYNIVFKDVGVGMNPDRMYNIFNNWFTSTKRESNDYIGAFGLGSKSPFSYNDSFYITTISDGLKYEYVYILTTTLPELISLYGYNEELKGLDLVKTPKGLPTDERNGTEIIIPLLNNNDYRAFEESIKKELCYFDNVYTKGFSLSNNYSIYKKEGFLYRPYGNYSNELHIVLGKCCYPVDWKAINRERVALPFGIRFEIGELQVIPNRESIVYDASDDDTIARLINSKIDKVLLEVNELLSKGGEARETDDLKYYLDNRGKKPAIWFGDLRVEIPMKYITDKSIGLIFKPLAHLPITIPNNPFFYYQATGYFSDERYEKYNDTKDCDILRRTYVSLDCTTNMYTNLQWNHWGTVKKENIKKAFKDICNRLGFYTYSKKYGTQYSIGNTVDSHYDYELIEDEETAKKKYVRQIPTLGKPAIILEYIRFMDAYAANSIKLYSSRHPTKEWIEEYKREKKESSQAYLRKLNGEVNIINHMGYRETVKLVNLAEYTNVIYYVTESRKVQAHSDVNYYISKLANIKSIAAEYKRPVKKTRDVKDNKTKKVRKTISKGATFSKNPYWKTHYKFVGIAQSNLSMLRKLDNLTYITDMKNFPLFAKYDQLVVDLKALKELKLDIDTEYSSYIKTSKYTELRKLIQNLESKFMDYNSYRTKVILDVSKDVADYIEKFKKEIEKLDILQYLTSYTPDKYLLPITSKLKTLYIKENYLGLNPVRVKKEEIINQNLMLL